MPIHEISIEEYQQRKDADEHFAHIDVRSPGEFAGVHASPASNVPLNGLKPESLIAEHSSEGSKLLLICQMGGRAMTAAKQLTAHQAEEDVYVLKRWHQCLACRRFTGGARQGRHPHLTAKSRSPSAC